MSEAALISHLIAQTQANISLILTNGYLNPSDATDIQNKLAAAAGKAANNSNDSILVLTRNLNISPPQPQPTPQTYQAPLQSPYQPPLGPPPQQPLGQPYPPPHPDPTKARALWAYNEDGREPNDLSFSAGEIIEIIEETNADWWKGRSRGRQGLFPSNYVEKLPPQAGPDNRVYKPFMAAHHGADVHPPASAANTNPTGLHHAEGQEQKKKKFGKYGDTIAHSAAGGLGFGAGAAVGSGIINSIF